jgi:hypothetical protein
VLFVLKSPIKLRIPKNLNPFRRNSFSVSRQSNNKKFHTSPKEVLPSSERDEASSAVIRDPEDIEALDRFGASLERCNRNEDAASVYRYRIGIAPSAEITSRITTLTKKAAQPIRQHANVTEFIFDPQDAFTKSLRRALKDE